MRRAGLGVAETFTALSDECYDSRTVRGMPMHYDNFVVVPNGIVVVVDESKGIARSPPPPQQVAQQFAVNQTARITLLEQQQ